MQRLKRGRQPAEAPKVDTLLTLDEVAEHLRCTTKGVRKLVATGRLGVVRFSSTAPLKFKLSDDLSLNDVVWLYHHLNDCYQGLYRPNSLNTPYLERSMNALQNGMRRAFLLNDLPGDE